MEEIWKDITGYEGLYQVSNFGRIRNQKGHIMSLNVNKGSLKFRYMIQLSKNNIKKSFLVHRLVAIEFLPNPENKETVNHIDGDSCNNNINNLEWATKSENHIHRVYTLKEHSLFPCKKVKCVETGVVYNSMCEASRKTGIQQSSISQSISGYRGMKQAGGYHWCYV